MAKNNCWTYALIRKKTNSSDLRTRRKNLNKRKKRKCKLRKEEKSINLQTHRHLSPLFSCTLSLQSLLCVTCARKPYADVKCFLVVPAHYLHYFYSARRGRSRRSGCAQNAENVHDCLRKNRHTHESGMCRSASKAISSGASFLDSKDTLGKLRNWKREAVYLLGTL